MKREKLHTQLITIVRSLQYTTGIPMRKDEALTLLTGLPIPNMSYFFECLEDKYSEALREQSLAELVEQEFGEESLKQVQEIFALTAEAVTNDRPNP
ncbi:hypothetical protein [Capnocytophaga gingivalis]|jgi:hypothetical protein|uniref:hypothetical protein n=1 Tax=Capnocytophaga gingivalis TaxID=1017 RepID=UPI0023F7D049|nr:hypothetical protein [Capnocytophaga gingivalis]